MTLMLNAGALDRVKLLEALQELDFDEMAEGLDYKGAAE
jgi:hypothetical protein